MGCTRLYHDLKAEMPEAKAFERLPKIITPVNYNIRLKPNLKVFTFEGSEDFVSLKKKDLYNVAFLYV
jgi:hypothetical protein